MKADRRSGKDRRLAAGGAAAWRGGVDRRMGPDRRHNGTERRRTASDYWVGPNDRRAVG